MHDCVQHTSCISVHQGEGESCLQGVWYPCQVISLVLFSHCFAQTKDEVITLEIPELHASTSTKDSDSSPAKEDIVSVIVLCADVSECLCVGACMCVGVGGWVGGCGVNTATQLQETLNSNNVWWTLSSPVQCTTHHVLYQSCIYMFWGKLEML